MISDSYLAVPRSSDLPFSKAWSVPEGYAIVSVTVSADGGTLGSVATVGNVTSFYLSSAVSALIRVTYTVTLAPYAVVTVQDLIDFS